MQDYRNYKVEIWFDQLPEKNRLGIVEVYAADEAEALELAVKRTQHWVVSEN